jgi:hypothetical protein
MGFLSRFSAKGSAGTSSHIDDPVKEERGGSYAYGDASLANLRDPDEGLSDEERLALVCTPLTDLIDTRSGLLRCAINILSHSYCSRRIAN